MLNWFNALVCAAVLIILIASAANAIMGLGFDAVSVAGSVFLVLILPVLYKRTTRRASNVRPRR